MNTIFHCQSSETMTFSFNRAHNTNSGEPVWKITHRGVEHLVDQVTATGIFFRAISKNECCDEYCEIKGTLIVTGRLLIQEHEMVKYAEIY